MRKPAGAPTTSRCCFRKTPPCSAWSGRSAWWTDGNFEQNRAATTKAAGFHRRLPAADSILPTVSIPPCWRINFAASPDSITQARGRKKASCSATAKAAESSGEGDFLPWRRMAGPTLESFTAAEPAYRLSGSRRTI